MYRALLGTLEYPPICAPQRALARRVDYRLYSSGYAKLVVNPEQMILDRILAQI